MTRARLLCRLGGERLSVVGGVMGASVLADNPSRLGFAGGVAAPCRNGRRGTWRRVVEHRVVPRCRARPDHALPSLEWSSAVQSDRRRG